MPPREQARRREDYIRPPLLAREPRSRLVTVWRFRLLALVLLAALAFLVLYVARNLINTEQNPTFGLRPAGHASEQAVKT